MNRGGLQRAPEGAHGPHEKLAHALGGLAYFAIRLHHAIPEGRDLAALAGFLGNFVLITNLLLLTRTMS